MSGKSRIPESELRRLVQDEGLNTNQVAERLGVHHTTVEARLRVLGIPWEPRGGGSAPALSDEGEAAVIRKYRDEGMGATTIAREHGIDKRTVYNILNRHGVGTRSVASRRVQPKHKARVSIRDIQIAEMYQQGNTIARIAEQMEVTEFTVRYSLRKQGLFVADQPEVQVRQAPNYTRVEEKLSANRDTGLRHNAFDTLTPEACYWAGFILADGCISRVAAKSPRLTVNLQRGDKGHLEKLARWLGTGNAVRDTESVTFGKPREGCVLSVTSAQIAGRLEDLGIQAGKEGRTVSPSLAVSRDFWRGLVDGDGSVRADTPRVYLSGQIGVVQAWAAWCAGVLHCPDAVSVYIQPQHEACWIGCVRHQEHSRVVLRVLYEGAVVFLDRKMERAMAQW